MTKEQTALDIARRMAELGGALTVANVPPQALKVLRAAGLERIIRFE